MNSKILILSISLLFISVAFPESILRNVDCAEVQCSIDGLCLVSAKNIDQFELLACFISREKSLTLTKTMMRLLVSTSVLWLMVALGTVLKEMLALVFC